MREWNLHLIPWVPCYGNVARAVEMCFSCSTEVSPAQLSPSFTAIGSVSRRRMSASNETWPMDGTARRQAENGTTHKAFRLESWITSWFSFQIQKLIPVLSYKCYLWLARCGLDVVVQNAFSTYTSHVLNSSNTTFSKPAFASGNIQLALSSAFEDMIELVSWRVLWSSFRLGKRERRSKWLITTWYVRSLEGRELCTSYPFMDG
jgi:hypothetical protein